MKEEGVDLSVWHRLLMAKKRGKSCAIIPWVPLYLFQMSSVSVDTSEWNQSHGFPLELSTKSAISCT